MARPATRATPGRPQGQPGITGGRVTALPHRRRVVLSYGMGADSTALLLRWIHEPGTRPCELADLLVITAMTGDEWPVTGHLVTRHVLPLLREHGIRWVQLARAGGAQADGITVLDDSRSPASVFVDGDWKLSDEMLAAGTVPQVAGSRKCSVKAKGWVLDTFLAAEMAGQPYLHVMGYEAGEVKRARRDAGYDTAQRTGSYPLTSVVRSSLQSLATWRSSFYAWPGVPALSRQAERTSCEPEASSARVNFSRITCI